MNYEDKVKVNEHLAHISARVADVLDVPGVSEYIGVILDWELGQLDHLLIAVLEDLLGEMDDVDVCR